MFSIVIPTWNNLPYIKMCVDSLRQNSARAHQIILHVNDGSDGTLDWVRGQGIAFTQSDTNVGICLAVNEAAALATQDYIVYMNDDMYVLPGWDTALIEAIPEDRSSAWLLSGTMIEPTQTNNPCVIVADHGRDLETFDESGLLRQFRSYSMQDWHGASWPPTLVHRRWWHMVGGYSTELSPGMASDTDFAMKLWAAGCREFRGVSDSRVYHFQCRSTGRVRKNDGGAQFLAKWGISQSVFCEKFLRRGQPHEGVLTSPPEGSLGWAGLKMKLKRRFGRQFVPFVSGN